MKLFVSLHMHGKPDADIIENQQKALNIIAKDLEDRGELDEPIEIIDTIHHNHIPPNPQRLHYLGASIQKLADADFVFFYDDWYKAKGCWVEFVAACLYEKKVIFDYPNSVIGSLADSVRDCIFTAINCKEDNKNG